MALTPVIARPEVLALATGTRRGHAGLWWFSVAMAVTAGALMLAVAVDDRTLLGANVWVKPLKFAVSFTLYGAALSWLLAALPRVSRPVRFAAGAIVTAGLVEMVIIVGQAGRGVASHFNEQTALDLWLFTVMGLTIVVLYVATVMIAVSVLRHRGSGPVASAVKGGLLIALLGMVVGVGMVLNQAHAVGVPDGGPGLPFVGWSTTGGDLRVGHFVGLHGLQVLPLVAALVIAAGRGRWTAGTQVRLVRLAGAGYAAGVLLVTWQAYRAQPLLAPDALTLAVTGGLVALGGLGLAVVLRADRHAPADSAAPRPGSAPVAGTPVFALKLARR